jgi:hypothetical protein
MLKSIVSQTRRSLFMKSNKNPMRSAADGLDELVARSLRKAPAEQVPVLAWPLACGSAVAARTQALEFADGILHVEVPDAGWRRELQALAPRYVATLNRYAPQSVTRVEFIVAGRKRPDAVPANKSRQIRRA